MLIIILFYILLIFIIVHYNKFYFYSIVFLNYTYENGFYPRALVGTILKYISPVKNNVVLNVTILYILFLVVQFLFTVKLFRKYNSYLILIICLYIPFFTFSWTRLKPEIFIFYLYFLCLVIYNKYKNNKLVLTFLLTIISLVGILMHNGYALLVFPFTMFMILDSANNINFRYLIFYIVICFSWFIFLRYYNQVLAVDDYNSVFNSILSNIRNDYSSYLCNDNDLVDNIKDFLDYEFYKTTSVFSYFDLSYVLKGYKFCVFYVLSNLVQLYFNIKLFNLLNIELKRLKVIIVFLFVIVMNIIAVDEYRWGTFYINMFYIFNMYKLYTVENIDLSKIKFKKWYLYVSIVLNFLFLNSEIVK